MSELTIISRSKWRAAARKGPLSGRLPDSIRELFIHYPGVTGKIIPANGWSEASEREIMRNLQRGHFANGWSDIGYNHVLFPSPDGLPRIYTARGAQWTPAAQMKHNTGTIAIMVYAGTQDILHESTKTRLRSYVRWVDHYTGNKVNVRGHREVVQTACPGEVLQNWVNNGRHR